MTPVWRFLFHGQVRHALRTPAARYAICGLGPVWFEAAGWYGAATTHDRQRLAGLRPCTRCTRRLATTTPEGATP